MGSLMRAAWGEVRDLECRKYEWGTEVCEELRKRRVDVCCLQKVRWRGQRARFMGVKGRRYKLWWSENSDGTGGVRVLVKEELCEKVVEVRNNSDRVMTVVTTLEE